MNSDSIPIKKKLSPEIVIKCPYCKEELSEESIFRLYRAYITLTRFSRKTQYKVICVECGKHSQIRTPLVGGQKYRCRQCIFREERPK